jgi:hypothetical protein
METQEINANQTVPAQPVNLFERGNHAIRFCAWVYGIYAAFLLLECIDFLSLLHTKEPGFHATYDIVHVAFFMVEFTLCAALTLGLLLLMIYKEKTVATVIITILVISVLRAFLVYYLYWQSEPKVHFVPYIYKKANELSGPVRSIFLPLQIISGFVCAWIWIKINRKLRLLNQM